jgi:hypothetical protein
MRNTYAKTGVADRRGLAALAADTMRLPCNRRNADKLWVYESQRVHASYFRKVRK